MFSLYFDKQSKWEAVEAVIINRRKLEIEKVREYICLYCLLHDNFNGTKDEKGRKLLTVNVMTRRYRLTISFKRH